MEEFSQMIAAELKLPAHRIANTLKLLQGGATIPFISRYRKEATGGLDEVQIEQIKEATFRHGMRNCVNCPNEKKLYFPPSRSKGN